MKLWTKNWTLWRLLVVVIVLVVFFAFDDILMIYLMSKWDFLAVHGGWYWAFYLTALLGSVFLALVVFEAMRRQPTTGEEGLVGESGRVVRLSEDGYQVKVMGEIWLADSAQLLKIGDVVVVESVAGLRLHVRKAAKG